MNQSDRLRVPDSTDSGITVSVVPPQKWYQKTMYVLGDNHYLLGHSIPRGFRTDGASVPRFAAILSYLLVLLSAWLDLLAGMLFFSLVPVVLLYFPPVGRYFMAAILHDFMLESGKGWSASNKAFNHAMKHLEIIYIRRAVMIVLVRAWGWYRVTFRGDKA